MSNSITARLFLTLWLFSLPAFAQYVAYNGMCSKGGQAVLTQGLASTGTQPLSGAPTSTGTGVVASYPGCLVTVYLTGTTNTAIIYSSAGGGALTNPFTASTVDGSFIFYTTAGVGYDITLSGGGLPATVTLTDVMVGGGGGGGGGSGTVTNIATSFPLTGGPITTTGTLGLTASCATNQSIQWNGSAWACATIAGTVSSVFGRIGAVVAATGDYTVGQVTGAAPLNSPVFTGTPTVPGYLPLTGGTLTGTLNGTTLNGSAVIQSPQFCIGISCISAWPSGTVTSVFGRTGVIVAQSGDYSFSQISGSATNGQLANSAITIAGTSVSLGGSTSSLPSPGAIGGSTPAAITGTTITANTGLVGPHNGTVGATTPNTGAFTSLSGTSLTDSGLTTLNALPKNSAAGLLSESSLTDNGTTVSTTEPFSIGASPPAVTGGTSISGVDGSLPSSVASTGGAGELLVPYAGGWEWETFASGTGAPSDQGQLVSTTATQSLTNKTISLATPTEIGYVHGVTSGIQAQLNAKLSSVSQNIVTPTAVYAPISTATSAVTTVTYFNNSGAGACSEVPISANTFNITLPSSMPATGLCVNFVNYGTGTPTILGNGSTFNGASTTSLLLPAGSSTAPTGAVITSNGATYVATLWGAGAASGGISYNASPNTSSADHPSQWTNLPFAYDQNLTTYATGADNSGLVSPTTANFYGFSSVVGTPTSMVLNVSAATICAGTCTFFLKYSLNGGSTWTAFSGFPTSGTNAQATYQFALSNSQDLTQVQVLGNATWVSGTSAAIRIYEVWIAVTENSGVSSINSVAGAFTFTGSGVSCTTTTCTFSGGGGGSTWYNYGTDGSSTSNVYTVTSSMSSYAAGNAQCFTGHAANTSVSPTVNFNSLGATTIVKYTGIPLAVGDISASEPSCVVYDGTNFQLLNPQAKTGTNLNVLSNNPTLTTPNIVTGLDDTNSNVMIGFTPTGSAVNNVAITNAATGGTPTIASAGTDTVVGLLIRGQDYTIGSSTPAPPPLEIRGANGTGATSDSQPGSGGQNVWLQGGANAGTYTNSQAGGIEIVPGYSTAGSAGSYMEEGVLIMAQMYGLGAGSFTQWNLVCFDPSARTQAIPCGASPTTVIGVTDSVGAAAIQVHIRPSQTPINSSNTAVLGDSVCAGSSAGLVTDSGTTTGCTAAQGMTIGKVIAVSGYYNLPDGNSATVTTSLPLIDMGAYIPNGVGDMNFAGGITLPSNGLTMTGCTSGQVVKGDGTGCATVPLVGSTTTFLAMGPNPTALTSSMVIFGPIPMTQAITVPANGANGTGTSEFILGTLPAATWTATIKKLAGSTAGCTGSATTMGTVAIATSGAQTWSTSATSLAIGDCLEVLAPSSVDTTAANPTLSLVVVK